MPEQITTWVMSVYEIENTIERLGAVLADPNGTKLVNSANASVPDLEMQIKNWQTVLADYRAVDAMIHPLAICSLPPRHPQSPPDEIEVAWDALSNTYVCLFDGACRLALEATSPADHAVPCPRHTKWSKV